MKSYLSKFTFLRVFFISNLLILNIAIKAQYQNPNADLSDDTDQFKQFVSTEKAGKTYLNSEERDLLYYVTTQNKVAGIEALKKYDPEGFIGFCFGRAMATNLSAKMLGLSKESIKKIFVIGDLRSSDDPEWRFHVATLVKGEDAQWYAIDPIIGKVVTMDKWVEIIHLNWDKNKIAKFYITSTSAILPDLIEFHPLTSEADHMILDILFNPLTHEGFTPFRIQNVYTITPATEIKYFSTVYEDEKNRFNFLEIKIESDVISYNDYFTDLVLTFNKVNFEQLKNDYKKRSIQPNITPNPRNLRGLIDKNRILFDKSKNLMSFMFKK